MSMASLFYHIKCLFYGYKAQLKWVKKQLILVAA